MCNLKRFTHLKTIHRLHLFFPACKLDSYRQWEHFCWDHAQLQTSTVVMSCCRLIACSGPSPGMPCDWPIGVAQVDLNPVYRHMGHLLPSTTGCCNILSMIKASANCQRFMDYLPARSWNSGLLVIRGFLAFPFGTSFRYRT